MNHAADPADRSGRHAVIMALIHAPGRGREGSPEDVLRYFGTTDGPQLGLDLLRDAVHRHDDLDLEMALVVCFTFGLMVEHLDLLVQLASADWHRKHEDVVLALDQFRSPAAVDALYHAAWWIPDYLEWDESRALARNAIHALGKTPGSEAFEALTELTSSGSEIVRETASRVLQRRQNR
jgi:hypothetical protein